ncbi:hypothetical protein ABPG72_012802 [Tetrahymena utriculariae]
MYQEKRLSQLKEQPFFQIIFYLEAIKSLSTFSLSSFNHSNQENVVLKQIQAREAFCKAEFPKAQTQFDAYFVSTISSQRDIMSLIKELALENQSEQVQAQKSQQLFKEASLIIEQFQEKLLLIQNEISLNELVQQLLELAITQSYLDDVNKIIEKNEEISKQNQIIKQQIHSILENQRIQFQNTNNQINSTKTQAQQNMILYQDGIKNYNKEINVLNAKRSELTTYKTQYPTLLTQIQENIQQIDTIILKYQENIQTINNRISQDTSILSQDAQTQSNNQKVYTENTHKLNIQLTEFDNRVQKNNQIQQENIKYKQTLVQRIEELKRQQENIKNHYQIDKVEDIIQIIKQNNQIEQIYYKFKQIHSELETDYELFLEHTAFNVKKANCIKEKMQQRRVQIKQNETIQFQEDEIKSLIGEISKDVQEQENIWSCMSIGAKEIIDYISTCDAKDVIFQELNIQTQDQATMLKEKIMQKQLQEYEKKLREEFNQHVQIINSL